MKILHTFSVLGLAGLLALPAAFASGQGDALLGGAIGGGVGAALGHQFGGRDGAVIGGALGGAAGAAIAVPRERHYRPAPHHYYHEKQYRKRHHRYRRYHDWDD
ncbi:hypothetical protein LH435_06670 [Laribacter hongkongensis]|uniref:hypothetical protein n=1 Tax=Laribacter hongkongensis TaxID=168471 RepID=UPI001EFC8952|nr:hypothetical protein [Laribacter hongkongensis]MCG8996115.1 hypothetical protein [Laribacter hongkongensis]MCG9009357.1 hypothetical protein [Laribacter hongkongensis]MCG9022616.1 hypothetical protein [Laribacter hongkongensis]MCG9045643.1 hypothetical protein [Laribacter hongkongensis]MCG9051581.1 hypothetical protein [Laribacter hongkongensis]